MRSRMSRGVPEWSGGKDLYMGSPILATGKCLGFFSIVPGSYRNPPGTIWALMGLSGKEKGPALGGRAPYPFP